MDLRQKEEWCKQKWEGFLDSDHPGVTVSKFLLAFIGIGSIAVLGATAPGLGRLVRAFKNDQRVQERYSQKAIENSFGYLRRKKLIKMIEEKEGRVRILLTHKGKKRLMEYSLDTLAIPRPWRWDGKWRVLIFDIPVYPKRSDRARDALREKIKELGFFQIQKSVWAYPYDCEDEILFIAEIYGVERYVEYMVVEKLLHPRSIRKHFSYLC